MRKIISFIAGAFAAVSAAQAQDIVANPTGVVPNLALSNIQPVLQEAGFGAQVQVIQGEQMLRVTYNDFVMYMSARACRADGNCAGLWMLAPLNDSASMTTINSFNQNSKPARATVVGTQVLLDRYLIADYGITRGSFLVNTAVMFGMIEQWFEFKASAQAQRVSFTPLIPEIGAPGDATSRDHEFGELVSNLLAAPVEVNAAPNDMTNLPGER